MLSQRDRSYKIAIIQSQLQHRSCKLWCIERRDRIVALIEYEPKL